MRPGTQGSKWAAGGKSPRAMSPQRSVHALHKLSPRAKLGTRAKKELASTGESVGTSPTRPATSTAVAEQGAATVASDAGRPSTIEGGAGGGLARKRRLTTGMHGPNQHVLSSVNDLLAGKSSVLQAKEQVELARPQSRGLNPLVSPEILSAADSIVKEFCERRLFESGEDLLALGNDAWKKADIESLEQAIRNVSEYGEEEFVHAELLEYETLLANVKTVDYVQREAAPAPPPAPALVPGAAQGQKELEVLGAILRMLFARAKGTGAGGGHGTQERSKVVGTQALAGESNRRQSTVGRKADKLHQKVQLNDGSIAKLLGGILTLLEITQGQPVRNSLIRMLCEKKFCDIAERLVLGFAEFEVAALIPCHPEVQLRCPMILAEMLIAANEQDSKEQDAAKKVKAFLGFGVGRKKSIESVQAARALALLLRFFRERLETNEHAGVWGGVWALMRVAKHPPSCRQMLLSEGCYPLLERARDYYCKLGSLPDACPRQGPPEVPDASTHVDFLKAKVPPAQEQRPLTPQVVFEWKPAFRQKVVFPWMDGKEPTVGTRLGMPDLPGLNAKKEDPLFGKEPTPQLFRVFRMSPELGRREDSFPMLQRASEQIGRPEKTQLFSAGVPGSQWKSLDLSYQACDLSFLQMALKEMLKCVQQTRGTLTKPFKKEEEEEPPLEDLVLAAKLSRPPRTAGRADQRDTTSSFALGTGSVDSMSNLRGGSLQNSPSLRRGLSMDLEGGGASRNLRRANLSSPALGLIQSADKQQRSKVPVAPPGYEGNPKLMRRSFLDFESPLVG